MRRDPRHGEREPNKGGGSIIPRRGGGTGKKNYSCVRCKEEKDEINNPPFLSFSRIDRPIDSSRRYTGLEMDRPSVQSDHRSACRNGRYGFIVCMRMRMQMPITTIDARLLSLDHPNNQPFHQLTTSGCTPPTNHNPLPDSPSRSSSQLHPEINQPLTTPAPAPSGTEFLTTLFVCFPALLRSA